MSVCLHVCRSVLLAVSPYPLHTTHTVIQYVECTTRVLHLFISDILCTVGSWLLHRRQTEYLQQVVLHHIPKERGEGSGGGVRGEGLEGLYNQSTRTSRRCCTLSTPHIHKKDRWSITIHSIYCIAGNSHRRIFLQFSWIDYDLQNYILCKHFNPMS